MTQSELASRAGLDAPLLNRYYNGKHRPSPETLESICSALLERPDRAEVVAGHLRDEIPPSGKDLVRILELVDAAPRTEEAPFADIQLTQKARRDFEFLMRRSADDPTVVDAVEAIAALLRGQR